LRAEPRGISVDLTGALIGYLLPLNKKGFMKKLLMVSNGAQLFRRIGASILAVVACVLFSFALWTVKAASPTPSATPDFDGANDPNKCTICHVPPGNPPKAKTLTIGCSAVQAHMRNHPGDCMGPCPCQPTAVQNP